MPKQEFALESGGPKRLRIAWRGNWKDINVTLDEQLLGTIENQKALRAGQDFPMPSGGSLHVQLVQKFSAVELQVLRDGQPLPGTASDPETRLKGAYGIMFFVAGLNLFLGVLGLLIDSELLQALGIGFYSILFGGVFLGLGLLVKARVMIALIIGIVIFALDGIVGFVFAAMGGATPSVTGILFRIFLLIPMVQGIGALRVLKKTTQETIAPAI